MFVTTKYNGKATASTTDWSRSARNKRLLDKAGSECSQLCTTDYYQILNNIEKLMKQNEELRMLLRSTVSADEYQPTAECADDNLQPPVTLVLQSILKNAIENSAKQPKQRRHPEILKKFAVLLFIYAGPLAYEFIHSNMAEAIPSLSTVKHIVHNYYCHIGEGEFRFDSLSSYLEDNGIPKVISIGEDATRVISRVEYVNKTNRCVGFVLPTDGNGLPMYDEFLAVSFEFMESV